MNDVTCVLPVSHMGKGSGLECILQLPSPKGYCLPNTVPWGETCSCDHGVSLSKCVRGKLPKPASTAPGQAPAWSTGVWSLSRYKALPS